MNNSQLPDDFEAQEDIKPLLTEREGELVAIIESITKIQQSTEWSTLKSKVFDGEVDRLERLLKQESLKRPLDTDMIYYLQGQRQSAKKYDLDFLLQSYRLELQKIRKQL